MKWSFTLILLSFTIYAARSDEHVQFFEWKDATTPVKIVTIDKDGDGKPERVEKTYHDRKLKLRIRRVEMGDKFYVTHGKLTEENDECPTEVAPPIVMSLHSDVQKLNLDIVNGFYNFGSTHRIHTSCFDKWGRENFLKAMQEARDGGMQCLDKLSKRPTTHANLAADILKDLKELWSKKPVSVICHETNYNWTGTAAHASVDKTSTIEGKPDITHPYISMASDMPRKVGSPEEYEKTNLSSTIFHEGIHNVGHKHGESIEVTYACQTCCSKNQSQNKDEQALEEKFSCKICVGDYADGANDKDYLQDLTSWQKIPGAKIRSDLPAKAIINYMNEKGDRRFGIFAIAEATDILSPVGTEILIELSKILPDATLTKEERSQIFMANAMKNSFKAAIPFREETRAVARAMINRHYLQDDVKAIKEIENARPAIQRLLNRKDGTSSTEYFTAIEIKKSISDVLMDVALKTYPKVDAPESIKALNLLTEFKMI